MNKLPEVILVIDDELQIQRLLKNSLSAFNIKIVEAMSGAQGLEYAITHRPELIILDIGLPDMSGLDVLRQIRSWSQVSIIILSARDEEEIVVTALENGADDYMTKPFAFRELLARIRITFKRTQPEKMSIFKNGPLEVNFSSRLISLEGKEISLTSTEYDLLKVFIKYVGKVVTHQQLLKEVWGPHSIESPQYVRVYVNHLRQKIELNSQCPQMILTETGVGYRFKLLSEFEEK